MMIILSPSKKLEDVPRNYTNATQPELLHEAETLITDLKQLNKDDISGLMKLSHALTELNYTRYHDFATPFTSSNSAPALGSFKGDVYDGLDASSFNESQVAFAQQHLRILSGLYGILRPLDRMQPYRLEMGTRLKTKRGKNLYQFWGDQITEILKRDIARNGGDRCLVNLASNEYAKVVNLKALGVRVLTVDFKELRNGEYRSLMLYVKRARGMLANYIITNAITAIEDIKAFDGDGYQFNASLSDEDKWTFSR